MATSTPSHLPTRERKSLSFRSLKTLLEGERRRAKQTTWVFSTSCGTTPSPAPRPSASSASTTPSPPPPPPPPPLPLPLPARSAAASPSSAPRPPPPAPPPRRPAPPTPPSRLRGREETGRGCRGSRCRRRRECRRSSPGTPPSTTGW